MTSVSASSSNGYIIATIIDCTSVYSKIGYTDENDEDHANDPVRSSN